MALLQEDPQPENLEEWFSQEKQRKYIRAMLGRVGITRRRAECFTRLWAYLLGKQLSLEGEPLQPLRELYLPEGFVPCSHREAEAIFYSHQEKGSERAAGMMLDKLVALGLIEKRFDGNTICIKVNYPPGFNIAGPDKPSLNCHTDIFNPRTDAVPVATFLARNYNWMNNNTTTVPHRTARWLRRWSEQYGRGMRVLRCSDSRNPVGFFCFYPTARESEEKFFLPPSRSLHLSSTGETDPIQIAQPGDSSCNAVFLRSLMIDGPYNQKPQLLQLLKDAQQTLRLMREDFPNLYDMHSLLIHPSYEPLAKAVGFQKTGQDSQNSLFWIYLAIDRYLALDLKKVLAEL